MGLCGLGFSLGLFVMPGLPGRSLPGGELYLAQSADPGTASVEDLQQQQRQIEQDRSEMQQDREQLQDQEQAAQQQLGGLQNQIRATSSQIADNENQLKTANDTLKSLQTELATAEEKYQGKQFSIVARLRYLQRQKDRTGLALLLQSQNLNEFLDRRYQLRRLYGADRQILAELRQDADALEKRRQEVETQKNQIALITQELQSQKLDYEAQAQTQQGLLQRLQQDKRALAAAEEQLAKDSANLTGLIQQRLAEQAKANGVAPRGTGIMGYPSAGVITSSFGYRVHPILGYSRFHSGVDFGADYGSPIWAADTGVVIFSGWYGGYGQAVIIDHGGSITTLYAHASEVYVSEGDIVQRGQVIAAIGSTGLSTGPHLHFEVSLNGEPIDPMSYF